jgi:hypothetical protein
MEVAGIFELHYTVYMNEADGKGKAIPLQAWIGPEDSRRLRLPEYRDNRYLKVVTLSALSTDRLYPARKYSCYAFLLEAESTPGP